jgi:endonuclease/exonuclease/phosphatase family metal-dependent hydrolase
MRRRPPRLFWTWFAAVLFWGTACAEPMDEAAVEPGRQVGESAEAKTVRFVAWNVWNYATEVDAREGLPVKPEEERQKIAEVLAGLRPDVIGLVEMGGADSLEDLRSRLRALGAGEFHPLLVGGPDENRHLALLSRWPVLRDESRPRVSFSLHGVPQVMRRGILDVVVEWPGWGEVRLVGVHLKSRRETPDFPQEEFRAEEFRLLRRHLEEQRRSSPELPVMIWGDFNTYKNETVMRDFLGARGHADAWQMVDLRDALGLTWTHYWAVADLYSRIDFLLLSSHWREILQFGGGGFLGPESGQEQPSDHRFLFYEFVLP